MTHRIDWQRSGKPDAIERARFYQIVTDDREPEQTYYFDPSTGTMWAELVTDLGNIAWESSIQTFPHGEVTNR